MLQWLKDIFAPWEYVGTVHGKTVLVDNEGNAKPGSEMHGYYVLTEKAAGRWRRSRRVGDPGTSAFAIRVEAQVKAWEAGGPYPDHIVPSEPLKPKPKGKAQLIAFPGGKQD